MTLHVLWSSLRSWSLSVFSGHIQLAHLNALDTKFCAVSGCKAVLEYELC